MKVGILTQPLHVNYGGVLQAYALTTVLQKFGHEVTILNRNSGKNKLRMYTRQLGSFLKRFYQIYFLKNESILLCNPFVEDYPQGPLHRFISGNMLRSRRIFSSKSLEKFIYKEGIGAIVVGSDQVWRQEYSPNITDFFLPFLSNELKSNIRKIAYAASFGTEQCDITSDKLQICRDGLKNFDAISVRELSALRILSETFNCSSGEVVLDPTLLLSASDYELLLEDNGEKSDTLGVVSYLLDKSNDKDHILREIQLAHTNSAKYYVNLRMFNGQRYAKDKVVPTLEEWLLAFRNADYVVTDSFHGCVFSIIFQKPFVVIANPDRGLDRFCTLLDKFGLRDRLVFSYDDFKNRSKLLLNEIDYEKVELQKQRLISNSLRFLKESLS